MNKLLLLSGCLFLIVLPQMLFGQAPTIQWDKTFGGLLDDYLTVHQATRDGGYILAGSSSSGVSGNKTEPKKGPIAYWIVKVDANGNKLWEKSYGTSEFDVLSHIQQTQDGGFIIGGRSDGGTSNDKSQPGRGGEDFWIIKTDSLGNKVWDKTFGSSNDDIFGSLDQTADGGYILGGSAESGISGDKSQVGKGSYDAWVIKIDANGNKQWDRSYGHTGEEVLNALVQTTDGGYVFGGSSNSGVGGDKSQPNQGSIDFWMVKIDANGNKLWDKTFGGTLYDYIFCLDQTANGGYILGGTSDSGISSDKSQPSRGDEDFWVIKTDALGNKIWDKTLGGNNYEALYSVHQTTDGGYFLGGNSSSFISGDKTQDLKAGYNDYWVLKLDASGTILWDLDIGGTSVENARFFKPTPDGGYLCGGFSTSQVGADKTQPRFGPEFDFDFWVVKLNPDCASLQAVLTTTCGPGGNTVKVDFDGLQTRNGSKTWTLTYKVNGGPDQVLSGTNSGFMLAQNAAPGSFYSLVNITSGSCNKPLNQAVTIQPVPAPQVVSPASICEPGPVTLLVTGAPQGSTYVWYNVATGGAPFQIDSIGTFATTTIYTTTTFFTAIKTAGCEGPRIPVTVNFNPCPETALPFIPNIITPNNDGLNDSFCPKNLPSGNWHLQVFNRWGIKIFEAEQYQGIWPEKKVSDGTYYYLLKRLGSGDQFKGWLEVKKNL